MNQHKLLQCKNFFWNFIVCKSCIDFIIICNDNANGDPNNIIFAIKDTKLYVLVVTLSAKDNQILSKLLSKDLKDQFIGMNIKQKVILKIQQVNIDIF